MADPLGGIVITGAGGHARVVAEALRPERVVGHLAPETTDPSVEAELGPYLGDDRLAPELARRGCRVAIGIGFVDRRGAERRARLLQHVDGVELATICHPTATISPSAVLGDGVFVGPGAVVGTGAHIGRGSIVNTGAVVDHDCRIGANVHIAPGVVLSGAVVVGDDVLVGVGSTVIQGVRIGSRVVVGAGAAVIGDLPEGATALGVPARPVGA